MATNHQKNFRVLAAKHHKAQKRGRVTYSLPIDLINAVQCVARILDMPASAVVEIVLTQAINEAEYEHETNQPDPGTAAALHPKERSK